MFWQNKNKTLVLWKLCTLLGLLILLGYLSFFLIKVYRYSLLSKESVAKINFFYVAKLSEDKYAIGANYSYQIHGKTYTNDYSFDKPYFMNEFSAEKNLKHWDMKEMRLWYCKKHPENSSLQKNFPFKNLIYLFVILFINLYFAYLRWYVTKRDYFTEESS